MSNIITSAEFMAKAKTAKSFEELKVLVAAEGVEVAESELMDKWDELSNGAKEFELSEEALGNVAGGSRADGGGYQKVMSYYSCLDGSKFKSSRDYEVPCRCEYCMHFYTFPGSSSSGYCVALRVSQS